MLLLPTAVQTLVLLMIVAATITAPVSAMAQQDAGPPAPADFGDTDPAHPSQRVVASVAGEPITSSDVAYSMLVLTRGQAADPSLEASIVRRMAQEILLATEADRLGLKLSPSQVDEFWLSWFGFTPDYEESAATAGTTVSRQRALAKRTVISELYVYNRVGLMNSPGARIDPDLALKHLVDVTPQQLREYFRSFRKELDRPATVSFAAYPAPNAEAAEQIQDALRNQRTPVGPAPIRQEVPLEALDEVFVYVPQLAEFVRNSEAGAVSEPVPTEGEDGPIVVVVNVTGRKAAQPAVFGEIQDELRNRLQSNLLVQAKEEIVRGLARESVYYPPNLFDEPARDR